VSRQYLENHHYYIRVVSESWVFVQYFQFRDLVRERFQVFFWAEISIWCNMSLTHLFTDSGTLHLVLNKVKSSLSVTTVLTSAYKVKSSRLSVTTVLCMQSHSDEHYHSCNVNMFSVLFYIAGELQLQRL
jgi:hypothetical protein